MEEKKTVNEEVMKEAHWQRFDPASYLQYNFDPLVRLDENQSYLPWVLSCYHRAFTQGDINGELLVDIGSGPTLYQVMSGCEVFNKVILTDFLEANLQELKRWVQDGGTSSLDWTPYLQHVCKLEGRGPSAWTEKAATLRKAITDILPIDVLRPQPIASGAIPSAGADCLVASFCLEAACPHVATYKKALGNIGTLLRPGGHLLLLGDLQESFYYASPAEKLPVPTLNEAQICASLKETGYTVISLEVYTACPGEVAWSDDSTASVFVKAKKK